MRRFCGQMDILQATLASGIRVQKYVPSYGDQPNDVLMFRPSGLSIAMGQASDEVKQAATYVTDSYNDEGFAKAVERFILGA